jgi:Family of unknown function (DUF5317)
MKALKVLSRIALWFFLFGLGTNSLVMTVNEDRMPVRAECHGPMCEDYRHVIITESTVLPSLGDVFMFSSAHNTEFLSIGDLTMMFGLPVYLIAELLSFFLRAGYLVGNGKGR